MKIGVLTQPLATNYGGLLQAYALQKILLRMGHDSCVISRQHKPKEKSRLSEILIPLKNLGKRLIGKPIYPPITEEHRKTAQQHCIQFINKYIKHTENIYSTQQLQDIARRHDFDTYIVGSDQVWRPCYSPCITNYFLDFCRQRNDIRRIAYAASFGVDNWEYTKEETEVCAQLAKQFDAITVREESGIALCRDHLGVTAEQALDPTMLLEKEDYEELVSNECEPPIKGKLFNYFLDKSPEKDTVLKYAEQKMDTQSYKVMCKRGLNKKNAATCLEECITPPPAKWLRAFMDAEMILTDSFHGCVFSIIFNKPFWVIINDERGRARFDSLLKTFNLENRKTDTEKINNIDLFTPIDWKKINKIRKEQKEYSINTLARALKTEKNNTKKI